MGPAINNLVINNDVHDNDGELGSGGGANGISVSAAGSGNVIRGNRAWRNADDGIDMWDSAPALIENNWVWLSGYDQDGVTPRGNGQGFKLGGSGPNDGGHRVRNNLSWKNRDDGFHENGGDLPMKMYNNTAWSNGRQSFTFFNPATTFRNNLAHGPAGTIPGSYPYNSWTLPVTVSNAEFASLDFTCARGPRQANGSLPNCSFLRLATGSDLIDKGTNVGIPYTGSAPDLGAFEYGGGGTSVSGTTPLTVSTPLTCRGRVANISVSNNTIFGGLDSGTIYTGTLRGTNGNDVIVGTDSNDSINGARGNDIICGGAGRDTLRGAQGHDRLFGERGRDRLFGNSGTDLCNGGEGGDQVSGCERLK